ncbi:hypothetical protein NDU88_006429 [Pleurodeles waltl]|uniref:Uncharacterized protein n=1 Tax=Pleurodeles waltl TaxID=8319 RepID=A0AAV7RQ74_PLEWA|nr:hypothetical protein NDU88_006429 [Pleurodeles waltl]
MSTKLFPLFLKKRKNIILLTIKNLGEENVALGPKTQNRKTCMNGILQRWNIMLYQEMPNMMTLHISRKVKSVGLCIDLK